MVAILGRWEIRTDASAHSEPPQPQPEASFSALDLEEAGDFIARQVLEKDAAFFEG